MHLVSATCGDLPLSVDENMHRFYLPDKIEPKPPGPGWDPYMRGTHDGVRDRIAAKFLVLPDFTCGFCGTIVSFPTEDISSVETEYTYSSQPRLRADVAAPGKVVGVAAIVEVVLTSKPSDEALAVHEGLPFVAYVEMNQHAVYCSPFCWRNQGTENLCAWSVPRCDLCERPIHQTFSETVWTDWSDPYGEVCLECAAGISDAQWRSPNDVIGGTEAPGRDATVAEKFLAFTDAEFGASVWEGRVKYPSEPHGKSKDESATAARLDQVEREFDEGEWDKGFELLQPIGASAWGARGDSVPLYAWEPENCARVSAAWIRLRDHRLSELPGVIADIIRRRGFRRDSYAEARYGHQAEAERARETIENGQFGDDIDRQRRLAEFDLLHRGFPDGRFTACGIDREKLDGSVRVSTTDGPTCPFCE